MQLISQSELGRLLNVPAPRIIRAVKDGTISPRAIVGRVHVFSRKDIPRVAAAVGVDIKPEPLAK